MSDQDTAPHKHHRCRMRKCALKIITRVLSHNQRPLCVASVVIVVELRSVTVSYPVQDRSDDVCARLLKEADGRSAQCAESLPASTTRQTPLKYFASKRVSLTALTGAESTITRS